MIIIHNSYVNIFNVFNAIRKSEEALYPTVLENINVDKNINE